MAAKKPEMNLLTGVFIVCLTIIFGVNTVAIKLALAGMGPLTAAGLRFALAAAAIPVRHLFRADPMVILREE